MSNKKIGFYFEDQLPNISTPLLNDFSFFYVKNEKSFNGEIVNIPKLFLYNKNINNFINLSGPDNYYVNSVNNIISNNGNIDLNLQNIVDKDNSLNKEIKFINGNYLYSKDDVSYFSNLSDTQINNFNNISNTILIGKNFGNINYELISNNNIFLGNNIKLPNNNISNNLILTNDLNISLNNYEVINNTFIGGYFYSENTEEFINQQIISGNIFIKGLGYGNIAENFKFNLPLTLSNNTKIIDNDNNNENDSLLYDNILVAKNNGLIGIKRINSFDFIPTLSQVLTKSGNPNTVTVENINVENLKFNNYLNNESISLDNKIGYLIIDNTGKILWKELENKPTLESVINENPNANTKPIFNEVEISNKLYVKNLTNKNNDILFDKIIITDNNGELAQISKNDLLSEKQDVLTEDNVGQFMDLKLSTKNTPSTGDTVLGIDSLTGKAVKIPTDQFGSGGGLALGETSSTAYRGDRGKIAYDHSQTTGNPHNTTKSDIGLGNVDNTSDLNKPISTATQNALDIKINKGTYTGTAQDLKNEIDGKANTSHTHNISDVTNLQTALDNKQNAIGYTPENSANKSDSYTESSSTTYASTKALVDGLATKQKKLSSFDESILIETDGNIEGNVSLFEEYFEQQECELNFIPIQIIGVYQDGIKLLSSEYEIMLPKKIKIKEYVDENIQIQYTKLKI